MGGLEFASVADNFATIHFQKTMNTLSVPAYTVFFTMPQLNKPAAVITIRQDATINVLQDIMILHHVQASPALLFHSVSVYEN